MPACRPLPTFCSRTTACRTPDCTATRNGDPSGPAKKLASQRPRPRPRRACTPALRHGFRSKRVRPPGYRVRLPLLPTATFLTASSFPRPIPIKPRSPIHTITATHRSRCGISTTGRPRSSPTARSVQGVRGTATAASRSLRRRVWTRSVDLMRWARGCTCIRILNTTAALALQPSTLSAAAAATPRTTA